MFWHQGRPEMASGKTRDAFSLHKQPLKCSWVFEGLIRNLSGLHSGTETTGSRKVLGRSQEDLGEVQQPHKAQPRKHRNNQQQIATECTNLGPQERNKQEMKIQESSYTISALKENSKSQWIQKGSSSKSQWIQKGSSSKPQWIRKKNSKPDWISMGMFCRSQACSLHLYQTLGQHAQLFLPLSSQATKTEYCFLLLLC